MSASKLIKPDESYRDSYLAALEEYHAEGRMAYEDYAQLSNDFPAYVQSVLPTDHMPRRPLDDWIEPVPESIFWLVKDGIYLGTVIIRHRLNWHLEKYGGNISYIIRPSARGKGFGQKILKRALQYALSLGLDRVMMTCAPDNESSRHIIESVGGRLHDTISATDRFPAQLRFWIELE